MSYVEYGQHRIVLHEHAYGSVRNGMRYAQWWGAESSGYGRQSGVARNYNDDVSTIDFCNGGDEAVTLRLKDEEEVVDVGVLDFGKVAAGRGGGK